MSELDDKECGHDNDEMMPCPTDLETVTPVCPERNVEIFGHISGTIGQWAPRRKVASVERMFRSPVRRSPHSYSVTFPLQHSFTLSMIASRLEHISKHSELEISRQGEDYVRYTISSYSNIGGALRSVLTRDDARCSIGTPFTSNVMYRTVAYMQRRAFSYEGCGHALQAALLSLKPGEALSVQTCFDTLGRRRHYNGQDYILMAITLHFSGTRKRLVDLVPETADKKKWKVRTPGRGRMRRDFRPTVSIDDVIPPFLLQMREAGSRVATRHYLHPSGHDVRLERMIVKDTNKTMQIGSAELGRNIIVFGGTGTGKTSSLAILAKTLIEKGQSVLTIDPNGDLGPKILGLLSPDCYGKAFYIDSGRTPAGINPISVLQADGLGDGWVDVVADAIAFSIRMTYGEKFYGPRLGYLLRLIIKGLAEIEGANLYDAYTVLTNRVAFGQFRQTVQDQRIREALGAEENSFFSDWGMPIKNKLGLLLFNDTASRMLCKRKNNLDIGRILAEGKSVLIDTDMASVGKEGPTLIGSFVLAAFWLKAMSLRKKLTIIIDEFQNYPIELIGDIATQGRKYGVNLIIATQSPSVLDKEHVNSFGSNFPVRLLFRLGQEDAMLASRMTTDIDFRELTDLPDLSCFYSSTDGASFLSIEEVLPNHESADAAIEYTLRQVSLEDDVMPSVFFQDDASLFKMLQALRTSATMDLVSISQLSDTGIFELMELSKEEAAMLVKTGRKMGFIDSKRLRLTNKGKTEMLIMQGGFFAGSEEHRMIALRTKDLLETLGGQVAYVPVQSKSDPLPDVIAVPVNGREGRKLFAEIEYTTGYKGKEIEMKIGRAWAQDAVPVLVFNNKSTAEFCYKKYYTEALILLFDEDDARIIQEGGFLELKGNEMLDKELYYLCTAKKARESVPAESKG